MNYTVVAALSIALASCGSSESATATAKDQNPPVTPRPVGKPATAERSWPKPSTTLNGEDLRAAGWRTTARGGWSADPNDPAAPMFMDVYHKGSTTGASAFAEALRAAAITGVSNARSFEVKGTSSLPGFAGKRAWTSGGNAVISGINHTLFASTGWSKQRGSYNTTLFSTPTASLRRWGGITYYFDAMDLKQHVGFVPAKIWSDAAQAPAPEQAQIYAATLDATYSRLFNQRAAIQRQTLQALQAYGRDLNTMLQCSQTSRCRYEMGAAPGQGRQRNY